MNTRVVPGSIKMKVYCLIAICLTFVSCSDYYFSEPQPVDSANTLKVPKKYRGTWNIGDNNSNEHAESLIIGESYYKLVDHYRAKESMANLELDSSIFFIDNKVYVTEDGELEGGYDYTIEGDSIIVDVKEIEIVEFGEKAFLRKIDYGYILNLQHEKMKDWWKIMFVDTRNPDRVLIRALTSEDLEKEERHRILHEDFSEYIVAQWSIEQIQKLIDNGGFSDTSVVLSEDNKVQN